MFFLLHKPRWLSSFHAVAYLRKQLGIKKAGHTGTLDPLATGLLLIATDHSTKLIPYIDKARKTYVFTVCLDGTTDSLDLDTPVRFLDPLKLERGRANITSKHIEALLQSEFLGSIRQTPPCYSALNIDGQRAYQLVRAGKTVEMKPREIEIYASRLIDFSFPNIMIEMEVSVGTYIRSIARDIGEKLGLSGYVTALHRSKIGHLGEDLAILMEDISTSKPLSYDRIFREFRTLDPDKETLYMIRNGIVFPNTIGLSPKERCFVREEGEYFSLVEECSGEVRVCVNKIS